MSHHLDPTASGRRFVGTIALLLALSVTLQAVRDRGWEPYEPSSPTMWLRAGPMTKRLALGFEQILADVYWMRAVVYYGGKRLSQEQGESFAQLYPLLELVTTLDPRFTVAYRFGAIFLAEAYPDGPGRPDQAIALLTGALDHNPDGWEYMHDIGFIHYWWLNDYQRAAQWFERAGDVEGAPSWLHALAATTLARGGDRESSRLLWRNVLDTSDVEWMRATAQRRLAQLDALDALDALNRIADAYATRTGRPPGTWAELVSGARLRGVPLDPAGVAYELDAQTGRIMLSERSPLWPLPVEPDTVEPGRLR